MVIELDSAVSLLLGDGKEFVDELREGRRLGDGVGLGLEAVLVGGEPDFYDVAVGVSESRIWGTEIIISNR